MKSPVHALNSVTPNNAETRSTARRYSPCRRLTGLNSTDDNTLAAGCAHKAAVCQPLATPAHTSASGRDATSAQRATHPAAVDVASSFAGHIIRTHELNKVRPTAQKERAPRRPPATIVTSSTRTADLTQARRPS